MPHTMHNHLRKETRSSRHRRTQRKVAVLYEYQDGLCCLCGKPMTQRYADTPDGLETVATLEHVIPTFHGGVNNFHNNLASHAKCNSQRHHALPSIELLHFRKKIHDAIRASDTPYAKLAWEPSLNHPLEVDILAGRA